MRWCEQAQEGAFLLDLAETGHLQSLLRKKYTERKDDSEHGQATCSLPFTTLHGHMQKMKRFSRGEIPKALRSLSRLSLPQGDFELVVLLLERSKYKIASDVRPGSTG